MDRSRPIGIFDSGIGGLTLASALQAYLPHERIVYFGDTAHLPYGEKSKKAIEHYSIQISHFLLDQGCKCLLIACNSASAAAFPVVQETFGSKVPVFNVIDPVVAHVAQHYESKKVGIIGTKQTIQSEVYKQKLHQKAPLLELCSLATPLLAPIIEEGFFNHKISASTLSTYLSRPELQGIEALILGCTHYPLIKAEIQEYYRHQIAIIDASDIVVHDMRLALQHLGLLAYQPSGSHTFYVSDYTYSFEQSTKIFFGERVQLVHQNIWD